MHWEAMQLCMVTSHTRRVLSLVDCSSQSSVSSMPNSKQQHRTMKATAARCAPYNMKLVHQ